MTTATPGRRSGKLHRALNNGRFYAVMITTMVVVTQICDTIVKVTGR